MVTLDENTAAGLRKKFQEISEHLELMIFQGKLQPGDKIPSERDLMAEFGAGRSSVREALFTLQRKGLLAVRPGAAARVTSPSTDTMVSELSGAARHLLRQPQGVRDLQNARALLEIGLSRHAALRARPSPSSTPKRWTGKGTSSRTFKVATKTRPTSGCLREPGRRPSSRDSPTTDSATCVSRDTPETSILKTSSV